MIQGKTLSKLAAISVAILAGAFWLNHQKMSRDVQFTPHRAFPNLLGTLDAVDKITIATQSGSFDVTRDRNHNWVLPSKGNYPAATPVVREVLLGVAELTNVEEKTSNPALLKKLDLQDISEVDSQATRVTLYKGKEPLADVLLGKERPDRANTNLNEIFIRFPDQNQSYLAKSAMGIYQTPTDWVETRLLNIPEARIQMVEVKPNTGEYIILQRDKPEQKDFHISHQSENMKPTTIFQANRIATALGQIALDDVMPLSSFPLEKAKQSFTAVLHTFDGAQIHFVSYEYQNKHYMRMAAVGPESNKQIAQWQNKFNNWVFVLPNWQYADISNAKNAHL